MLLKDAFKGVGTPITIAAVTAAIGTMSKKSLDAAASIEQLHNKASVVFGDDFPAMQAGANAMGAALNRSESDILAFQTNLALVANDLGITGKHAETLSQNMTQLGIDLSKAMGGTQEEAIQAITLALQGSGKALRQYTIALNDDTLQQFANTKGIKDKVAEMTQAQKAYITEQYLLENTAKIQEIAAKNTGLYADRVEEFKGAWQDMLETTGKPLLPAASAILEGVSASVHALTEEISLFLGWWDSLVSAGSSAKAETAKGGSYAVPGQRKVDNTLDLTSSAFAQPNGDKFSRYVKDSTDQVKKYYGALGDPNRNAEKGAEELKKFKQAMEGVGKTYQDVSRDVASKLIALEHTHAASMKSIRDDIEKTTKSIKDLETQYQRSISDINISDADAIVNAGKDIESLTKKLEGLATQASSINQNGGSVSLGLQQEIEDTQKELDALVASRDKALAVASSEVLSNVSSRGKQTDLDKALTDSKTQRQRLKEDHDNRLAELMSEKKSLEDKKTAEELAYTAQRTQLQLTRDALDSFVSNYSTKMADLSKVTEDTVKDLASKLDELKATIANIDSLVTTRADLTGGATTKQKANARAAERLNLIPNARGGIYDAPTAALIGEAGYPEAVIPMPFGNVPVKLQGESRGSNITIHMGPFTITKEVDASTVIARIKREIQLTSLAA